MSVAVLPEVSVAARAERSAEGRCWQRGTRRQRRPSDIEFVSLAISLLVVRLGRWSLRNQKRSRNLPSANLHGRIEIRSTISEAASCNSCCEAPCPSDATLRLPRGRFPHVARARWALPLVDPHTADLTRSNRQTLFFLRRNLPLLRVLPGARLIEVRCWRKVF